LRPKGVPVGRGGRTPDEAMTIHGNFETNCLPMNEQHIYLIKDRARRSGHSIHTVKYYLRVGLIKEISRSPGTVYLYFDDSTLRQLQRIRALRKKKTSLKDIADELL
jgi:hypothetical protein